MLGLALVSEIQRLELGPARQVGPHRLRGGLVGESYTPVAAGVAVGDGADFGGEAGEGGGGRDGEVGGFKGGDAGGVVGEEAGLCDLVAEGEGEGVAAQGDEFGPGEIEGSDGGVVFVGEVAVPHAAVVGVEVGGDAGAEKFRERVAGEVGGVVEELVGDKVGLDEDAAGVLEEEKGTGVAEEVEAVADAGGAEEEGLADVVVGCIHLARVDGEGEGRVAAAEVAKGGREAGGVAAVVFLDAGQVEADPKVTVGVDPAVFLGELGFGAGVEAEDDTEETHGDGEIGNVGGGEAGAEEDEGFVAGEGDAVGEDAAGDAEHGFEVGDVFGGVGFEVIGQKFEAHVGVAVDVAHALPVGAEELGAALAGGVEAEGVVPVLALDGGEVGEGNVFGAGGGREVVVGVAANGVETHAGRDGIGRGGEAGASVVGDAAVAGGVGEDGPHPLGAVRAASVVVEIAAFREGVE